MKLLEIIRDNLRYDIYQIPEDVELSQEISNILLDLGLMMPNVEADFGPISTAVLRQFQLINRCYEPGFVGVETATCLLKEEESDSRKARGDSPIQTLVITQTTVLKTKPLDAKDLPESEKYTINSGTKLKITSFERERKHLKFTLVDSPINNRSTWYVFEEHAEILAGTTRIFPNRESVKWEVPYKSQMDNEENPTGSCNVTSLAMCLEYLKIPRRSNSGQFEDELYSYAIDHNLDRHVPEDLACIVRDYGAKDRFTTSATIEQVKDWLAEGNPVVIHGYFSSSGHIIVIVGYDSKGFIVHDPYGEWFASGYDRNSHPDQPNKGKFLHYSYELIQRTCIPDGSFWVHFISR